MTKEMSARLIVILLVLLLGVLATAYARQPSVAPASPAPADTPTPSMPGEKPQPALDGEALLKERCTQCHGLSRVEQARKTETGWQKTVERMVAKGTALNAEEQVAVIKYLAETYAR